MSSYATIDSPVTEPAFDHAWRDGMAVHATVSLGRSTLYFDSPALARAVAAECLTAAGEMEALPPAQDGGGS